MVVHVLGMTTCPFASGSMAHVGTQVPLTQSTMLCPEKYSPLSQPHDVKDDSTATEGGIRTVSSALQLPTPWTPTLATEPGTSMETKFTQCANAKVAIERTSGAMSIVLSASHPVKLNESMLVIVPGMTTWPLASGVMAHGGFDEASTPQPAKVAPTT